MDKAYPNGADSQRVCLRYKLIRHNPELQALVLDVKGVARRLRRRNIQRGFFNCRISMAIAFVSGSRPFWSISVMVNARSRVPDGEIPLVATGDIAVFSD